MPGAMWRSRASTVRWRWRSAGCRGWPRRRRSTRRPLAGGRLAADAPGRHWKWSPAALLGAALLLFTAIWRWRGRGAARWRSASTPLRLRAWRAGQALALGVTLVTLAFTLTFRALPAHYMLDFLPLVPLLGWERDDGWRSGSAGSSRWALLGQIPSIPACGRAWSAAARAGGRAGAA